MMLIVGKLRPTLLADLGALILSILSKAQLLLQGITCT